MEYWRGIIGDVYLAIAGDVFLVRLTPPGEVKGTKAQKSLNISGRGMRKDYC
jgi:hypothetical protein